MKKAARFDKTIIDYLQGKTLELIGVENEMNADYLERCQSPIEQLLFLALTDHFKNLNAFFPDLDYFIEPQFEIENGENKYRADFLLRIADYAKEKNHLFVIECDGHDFHEKTKEQIRNDRSRERIFLKKGFTVIRFSGSEIFESPDGCAFEVWEIMKGKGVL